MKIIIALLASTCLIGAAGAQTTAMQTGLVVSVPAGTSKSDVRIERHIMDMHGKLGITPAEEGAWTAFAQTMRDNATDLDMQIQHRQTGSAKATALDDLNAYAMVAQAHADGVKKLASAFEPVYAAMSDAQKKVADGVFVSHHAAK